MGRKEGRNTGYRVRFSLGRREKDQMGRMPYCGIQKTLEDQRLKLLAAAHCRVSLQKNLLLQGTCVVPASSCFGMAACVYQVVHVREQSPGPCCGWNPLPAPELILGLAEVSPADRSQILAFPVTRLWIGLTSVHPSILLLNLFPREPRLRRLL